MSGQWETARHCHMALYMLATKIRQTEDNLEETSHPHAYALRDREARSLEFSEVRRQKRFSGSPTGGHQRETQSPGRTSETSPNPTSQATQSAFDPTSRLSHLPEEPTLGGMPAELDFSNMDPSQLPGSSNFDLNMVDLLQGANFDSLFDVIGQQYPSF